MKPYTFDLDEELMEDLYTALEIGKIGHRCVIDSRTPSEAAKQLCERLIPFFEKKFVELEEEEN